MAERVACAHASGGSRQPDRVRAQDLEEGHVEGRPLQGDEEAGLLRETLRQAEAQAGRGTQEAPKGHEAHGVGRLAFPPGAVSRYPIVPVLERYILARPVS